MQEKMTRFRKWFENYWYHHSALTLVILFFVVSGVVLTVDFLKKKNPDFVVVYAGHEYGSASQFAPIEDKAKEIVGDLDGDGQVKVNFRLIAIRTGEITDYDVNKEQQFNYSFLDEAVHLYLIEKNYLTDKSLYFEPLDSILPADRLRGGIKNEAGEVYAVPLSGNRLAEEMDFAREDMYIAVKKIMDVERDNPLAHEGQEKAKELLQYIVNEGK